MQSLAQKLTAITTQAFESLGLPPEAASVQVSGQAEIAQFQCNGALQCAKAAKKNPREIAQAVIDKLKELNGVIFKDLSIGGPGFINITLTDDYIAAYTSEQTAQPLTQSKKSETIILDYGGPNIAKAMHVGHLRASIIGDALRRMYSAAGYKTLGDVHMGDWGTPMGMLLADYIETGDDKMLTKDANIESLMRDMEERYPRAATKFKEDENFKAKAMQCTVHLQAKKQPEYGLWSIMRDVSINAIKANFDRLGVHFDLWKGEADAHDYIAPMVDELKKNSLAVESDGALVVPVAAEGDKKEIPPLILYKRDGAVLYGTTDMGTLVQRMKDYAPAKVIYIVDQRQNLHFEQVFRAVRKSGIVPERIPLIFAGFGTMNGPDGKPFKTRAGGVMKLEDLISMGVEKAKARLDEADIAKDMPAADREDIAQKVALAALKFADLQNNRIADYIFDIDRMTSFEGKTGPYLLYQAVRIQSLLAKAGDFKLGTFVIKDGERKLALMLSEMPDHFVIALENNTPHVLCDYAYKLAQEFSSFYGNCHILSETDESIKTTRLALCQQTHKQLSFILSLLGISIPERM